MGSSLLTLVQNACAELGLAVPGTVAGATDAQTVQMFALANAVGADLLTRTQWTALQVQAVINVETPLTGTGNTTDASAALTNILGVGGLGAIDTPSNYLVSGSAIPTGARLTQRTVAIPASATMDMQASGTTTGEAMVFARDTYEVPADFVTFINDTQWDNGNHWRLQGPASPQEDAWLRSGIVTTGPRRWFRQVGRGVDVFRLWPPPAASDVPGPLVYQYLSKYWASAAATATPSGIIATPKAAFTADDDTCIYEDRLIVEGLKWRFFAAKGFDYSSQFAIWQRQLDVAMARDGGAPMLDMARRRYPVLISPYNIADGNWPG
jgi:hypothetical protein